MRMGCTHFRMDQPIPGIPDGPAGDLAFAGGAAHRGVRRARPDKAAYEFGNMEDMLTAAEDLYGPYRWDRYDACSCSSFPSAAWRTCASPSPRPPSWPWRPLAHLAGGA